MNNAANTHRIRLIVKEKEIPEEQRLKAYNFPRGLLLMAKRLNAQVVLTVINELYLVQEELLDSLDEACGPCDELCGRKCPIQDQNGFSLSPELLAQADIPADARLFATPDPEESVIIIREVDEREEDPHETQCFSMRLVAERGLCLSRLSKLMNSKQIVYEVD